MQVFRYLPAGDGVVTVSSDDPFLSENVDITLNEHSDNVLVLTALMHKTGKPLIVETVTVVDNLRRVRTVQVQGRHCQLSIRLSRAMSVLGACGLRPCEACCVWLCSGSTCWVNSSACISSGSNA